MNFTLQKFKHDTPLGADTLQGHINSACARGLPEAVAPATRLDIVANGPSASAYPHWSDHDSMALNGALGLFPFSAPPTYWTGLDPQPLLAGFLADAPIETTYLLASIVHPTVFDLLRNYDVRLWHVEDTGTAIPPGHEALLHGSSVTLCTLFLAPRLGYWDLHYWGWDCCFLEGEHHAHGSAPPEGTLTLNFGPDPEAAPTASFLTTPTWASEVNQAVNAISYLRRLGLKITVHGPGLLAHALAYRDTLPDVEAP